MTDLLELAARVEGLQGPDREVDALIADATGWWLSERERLGSNAPMVMEAARFTGSLDAATSLVPGGWGWTVGDKSPQPSLAWCEIDHLPWCEGYGWAVERKLIVHAATPVLALVVASLRARAHGGGEG